MRILCLILSLLMNGIISAQTIERKVEISTLDKLKIDSFDDVIIVRGEEESIKIIYEKEYEKYIKLEKKKGNVNLYVETNRIAKCTPKLFVTIKDMTSVKIINCGDVKFNKIDLSLLDIYISSCDDIYLNNISLTDADLYIKSSDNIVFNNVKINKGHLKIAACKDIALNLYSENIDMLIKASDDVNIKGKITNLLLEFSTIDNVNVDTSFYKAIISSKYANQFKLSTNKSNYLDLSLCFSKKIIIGGTLSEFILRTSRCEDLYIIGETAKFIYNNLGVDKCNTECFTYKNK